MDDGASEVFMNMNDHSGCFSSCIAMTATGDDGGSGDPFLLWVSNAIMGQQKDHSVFLAVGLECSVIQSEVNTGWGTGTGVNTEFGWTGNIHITGNNFRGGGSGTGIKLYGQYSATQISLNSFDGTYSIGINVDDGGGTIF